MRIRYAMLAIRFYVQNVLNRFYERQGRWISAVYGSSKSSMHMANLLQRSKKKTIRWVFDKILPRSLQLIVLVQDHISETVGKSSYYTPFILSLY